MKTFRSSSNWRLRSSRRGPSRRAKRGCGTSSRSIGPLLSVKVTLDLLTSDCLVCARDFFGKPAKSWRQSQITWSKKEARRQCGQSLPESDLSAARLKKP